jgi:penicillin-binding protein 2
VVLQHESNRQLIQQRLSLFRLPVLLIFFILAARLWQLQIIQGSMYALKAEHNRIRTIPLFAPRGTISDRNHIPLVDNLPSFDVLLYRESMKNRHATERFLAEELGIEDEAIMQLFKHYEKIALYYPMVIKKNADIKDISIIEAHRRDFPEIQLEPEPRRNYHYGKVAAHLLGYLGYPDEKSKEELAENKLPGAAVGSQIGRSGIERMYNRILRGKDGVRQVSVDSKGREVEVLGRTDSIIGDEIQLTLDLDLQMIAEKTLENKVGAIVGMDPRNGEILVIASSPSFDPNAFATKLFAKEWNALVNNPDRPMQNRAIQNSYPPGSIFKVIMAEAGLEEGLLDKDPAVNCKGSMDYKDHVFHCWDKNGHGPLRLEQAIQRSCNIFFYELGQKLGIEKIYEHAHALGLGVRTGIDLPGERSGLMPNSEWKMRTRHSKWYEGETISVSIGQGATSATPIQILRAISAIATGGLLTTPHVLLSAENEALKDAKWPIQKIPIGDEHAGRIRAGMWASVNNGGTGHNAAIPGRDICGKTGTVQVISNENRQSRREDFEDHSWFAGFASRDNPGIAVVVFIEHGGTGGVAAAPLAKQIFSAYFDKQKSNKASSLTVSNKTNGTQ